MSNLRLTEARTILLHAIADGLVYGDAAGDAWLDERLTNFYDPTTAGRWKVTVACRRALDAGWVEIGPRRKYKLTEAGRGQLEASVQVTGDAGE